MNPNSPEGRAEVGVRVFVDAHVHIHPCFDIQKLFDAAARNFMQQASRLDDQYHPEFVLCLTETSGVDTFGNLVQSACQSVSSKTQWIFKRNSNNSTVVAHHEEFGSIHVVAGRQIVTKEKLEVLALGLDALPEDGLPIGQVVSEVTNQGAIPVIPWGFGKWLASRRRVVEKIIEQFSDGVLYLGDNSGRPAFMPTPPEFQRAREIGMRILPGTDPLPFGTEFDRAGSFGFYVDGVKNNDCIWTELRTMLQRGEGDLHQYGSLESPLRFVRNQVAMQYLTRVKNRWAAS